MVNTVLAIILILATQGIGISRFGATMGLLVGGALAAAAVGAFILLANIRDVLKQSRAIGTDSTRQGEILQSTTEEDAGGTPALPGDGVPLRSEGRPAGKFSKM